MTSALRIVGIASLGLIVVTSACSSSDDAPPRLTAAGKQPIAEKDPVTGTVGFFMPSDPEPALAPGADPGRAAVDYLAANGPALGIPNAKDSFVPIDASKDDDDNTTHVKLQQVSNGIEVWGVVTTVHFDDAGFVAAVDGPFIPNLDAIAKQTPAIAEAAGRAAAQTESLTLTEEAALGTSTVAQSLVIYVNDDYSHARLAWHCRTTLWTADSLETGEVFVDAMNGAVLASWNDSSTAEQLHASALGYDGKTYQTPIVSRDGIFRHARSQTSTQSQIIAGIRKGTGGKANSEWQYFDNPTLDGPWDPQAVTAFVNIEHAERFYLETLGWDGPSGKRSNIWVAVRDPLVGRVNAFTYWSNNGTDDTLTFTTASLTQKSPVICIDVVGHEFTHLVTAYNSKLTYRAEPGAINESLSDIFGAFVERKVNGVDANTYLEGEAKGEASRDMRHPTSGQCKGCVDNYASIRKLPQGAKPDKFNDSGFVHFNSSIVNNAWALMVDGGTNDTSKMTVKSGIGWDKSIRWWWKTQRHLATPRMDIRRLARLQSGLAMKSKGRFDPEIIACAWAAVGGVAVDWARNTLDVKCAGTPADGGDVVVPKVCQGKADGTYCSEPDRFFGYVCKGQAVVESLRCPPPNTHCVGPSADGKSLVCTN